MYENFEDVVDAFLEDLSVNEHGDPCLDCNGAWSIIKDHDGGFYLSSLVEDYRDEIIVSGRDLPDLWQVGSAFDPSDPEDVSFLRGYFIHWFNELAEYPC